MKENIGALDILKTMKRYAIAFFIMWACTFIAFSALLIYTIHLQNEISIVETQEVEQETGEGSNYFIGRDGDIKG